VSISQALLARQTAVYAAKAAALAAESVNPGTGAPAVAAAVRAERDLYDDEANYLAIEAGRKA
jgi:hypothetical protein